MGWVPFPLTHIAKGLAGALTAGSIRSIPFPRQQLPHTSLTDLSEPVVAMNAGSGGRNRPIDPKPTTSTPVETQQGTRSGHEA